MSENETAYHVIVEGRVTGVGFRWSALSYARNLPELKGYIRNASYEKVEVVIQGPETQVKLMLDWLRHGPSYARIDDIKVNPYPLSENLDAFTVKA
ncbi:MAG: acylphosphatase [Victivallales bacterium]|jgi:acylphosphatase